MRGRLINPFVAVIQQIDTNAMRVAGKVDNRFRAPIESFPQGPEGVIDRGRIDKPDIRLRCQVEPVTLDKQRQGPGGNVPDALLWLVFHFRDLELANLVDREGRGMIRVNDRLTAIETIQGAMHRQFSAGGLYAIEPRDIAFGLGRQRNLFLVGWSERQQGLARA